MCANLVRAGYEQEAKQVLASLDKLDASDAEFDKLLAEFTVAALQHIELEEAQVWPALRAALTAETAAELGAKIADGKSSAPRPLSQGTSGLSPWPRTEA